MFARLHKLITRLRFPGSSNYWERRYRSGGNSGVGSYGKYAEFKAAFLNQFVVEHAIQSVVELGCGDGNQLSLANYPRYTGFDVSSTAIQVCRQRFQQDRTKQFFLVEEHPGVQADLALSLDVIFHLVEDDVFTRYMTELFASATRFVIVFSSDYDQRTEDPHVRHRPVSKYVAERLPDWRLLARANHPYPPEENFANFMVFAKDQ